MMPSAVIKSYSEKSGKSIKKIDQYWEEAKIAAKEKGLQVGSDSYWAYVNAITERRAGLKESLTFKEFLLRN